MYEAAAVQSFSNKFNCPIFAIKSEEFIEEKGQVQVALKHCSASSHEQ